MYLPKHFSVEENQQALRIVDTNPFATLVSFDEQNEPFFNNIPILIEQDNGNSIKLIGHMARRNPQWKHFANGSKVIAIFNGPHTYVTPTWYVSGRDVPTWNYAVVHCRGTAKLREEFDELVKILKKMTVRFEELNSRPWKFELPDDLIEPKVLTSAIVGFEINVEKIEAKFKLSQNRSTEDKNGIIEGLGDRTDDMSKAIRKMMAELL